MAATSWTEGSIAQTGWIRNAAQVNMGDVEYLFGAIPISQGVFINAATQFSEASLPAPAFTEASVASTAWTKVSI